MSNLTILCLGRNGQLAQSLKHQCPTTITLIQLGHKQLSYDFATLITLLSNQAPDVIINTAAFTNVEAAESDDSCFTVNGELVELIGLAAQQLQVPLLHISTDYVFAGDNQQGYAPNDATAPINNYGRSKLMGEQRLLELPTIHGAIIRTSWLYSPFGHNFFKTMLGKFKAGQAVQVINDQYGCPTSALGLATAVLDLATQQAHKPTAVQLMHWADQGTTTWYGFACEIAQQAYAARIISFKSDVKPVSSDQFPTKARRPHYSILLCTHDKTMLKTPLRQWQHSIAECIGYFKNVQEQ